MTSAVMDPRVDNSSEHPSAPKLSPNARAVMLLTERASEHGLTIALQDGRTCSIYKAREESPLNIAITSADGLVALAFRADGTFVSLLRNSDYPAESATSLLQQLVRATEILAQA